MERKALQDLIKNRDIVIKCVDKGRIIVFQDHSDYVKEALSILSHTNYYMKLTSDPTSTYMVELDLLLQEVFANFSLTKKMRTSISQ